ncbi:hypothetical protein L6452_43709 [Arctium lappa]|uniref:Uncharacterized protein n=1 Tax=Arctium lappa TaxID=4217 RepID=A0ACB8XDV7_ARCLA|nr:hypothetical protein L6452_43709 [Arctium lappa]
MTSKSFDLEYQATLNKISVLEKEIEAERKKLKNQNSKLLNQIQELKSKLSNSDKTPVCAKCTDNAKSNFADQISALEAKNADLMKSFQSDKDRANLEKSYTQKLSDISKKTLQEKKDLELRCSKLSKQVESEFPRLQSSYSTNSINV